VWKGGKETISCKRCGDTKEVKAAEQDKARFCSQDCMLEWRSETIRGENHPRHKEETKELYYGPSFPEQREKALERDNHACRVCGRSEATQVGIYGCGLNCHHIRKFREFDHHEEANRLENLVMLCSQCHQHVENYQINVPAGVWHRAEAAKAVVNEGPIPTNLTLYIA
jgi:5-methylcytosine-specific restriction endonuclease McrA